MIVEGSSAFRHHDAIIKGSRAHNLLLARVRIDQVVAVPLQHLVGLEDRLDPQHYRDTIMASRARDWFTSAPASIQWRLGLTISSDSIVAPPQHHHPGLPSQNGWNHITIVASRARHDLVGVQIDPAAVRQLQHLVGLWRTSPTRRAWSPTILAPAGRTFSWSWRINPKSGGAWRRQAINTAWGCTITTAAGQSRLSRLEFYRRSMVVIDMFLRTLLNKRSYTLLKEVVSQLDALGGPRYDSLNISSDSDPADNVKFIPSNENSAGFQVLRAVLLVSRPFYALLLLLMTFIASLGNNPKSARGVFHGIIASFALIAVILLAIIVLSTAAQLQIAKFSFTNLQWARESGAVVVWMQQLTRTGGV
ncbi:hypothetical protein H9P43_004086 [Blastocladiella emersonii ATCC 22665]|nr:hypothetical protein H9P43_004086 [Blastocladiella emersonii ATCC 22665]